jgi:hypothetical protein
MALFPFFAWGDTMTFEEQLAIAQQSGRLYRVIYGPSGGEVEYLSPEEEAEARAASQEAERRVARERALQEIVQIEKQSVRALRELVLRTIAPDLVSEAEVADAMQVLRQAEERIRAERAKLK